MKKFESYLMSLMLLFILLIIKAFNIPDNCTFRTWIASNIWTILFIILFLVSILCSIRFFKSLDGARDIPAKIIEIKNGNYEYITFLMSYILPLICFDLSCTTDCIILVILLIVLGLIFGKTNLYSLNPIISLLGIRIYVASIEYKETRFDGIYLLSKEKLHCGDLFYKHDIEHNEVTYCCQIIQKND